MSERASESLSDSLLQMAVSVPELTPFLHSNLPERDTLYITGRDFKSGKELLRENQVVIYEAPSTIQPNSLYVHEIEVSATTAKIQYEYHIEGVFCEVYFEFTGDSWVVDSVYLVET
ncbi:MAG TPA: hypothetical protein VLB27_07090 [candidate division Zixibacteria bacterium]|nr:hypothetical protein [candidate division Zixibacteria bacterium]